MERIWIAALGVLAAQGGSAATIDQQEYDALVLQAQSRGAARVMVQLAPATLQQLQGNRAGVEADMKRRESELLRELGGAAWKAGAWSNGIGQVGLYLTPTGLRTLAASSKAQAFGADPTHRMRSRIVDVDGRIAALERATEGGGTVEAELTLNLERFDFELPATAGAIAVRHSPELAAEAAPAFARLAAALATAAPGAAATLRHDGGRPALARLKLDAQALAYLRESDLVRGLRPAGHVDTRPTEVDPDILVHARAGGTQVIVDLRLPDGVLPSRALLPARAWQAQRQALSAAFREIVAALPGAVLVKELDGLGSAVLRIGEPAARQLLAGADPRILKVSASKPMLTGMLPAAIPTLRMDAAHAAGHTAAGQRVVVIDSGVRKNHAFFGGSAKVIYEGCWGTNNPATNPPVVSLCPPPSPGISNPGGDSTPGTPGSGEPIACPSTQPQCASHGTHVAGIAAGLVNGVSGYRGVAPAAGIVAFNVASWDASYRWWAMKEDLVLALQAVRDLAPDPNFVVNMSIGWSNWKTTADCPGNWLPMTNMVKDLHDRGIPVIVSAGNEGTVGNRFGVNFPSCVPHTVKVAATLNDGNGNTIASASNIVPQGSLTGPVLLAPGYSVTSAMATGPTDVAADGGTSMAAPQVAGYYAVLKAALPGFTLPDITAWIMSSGSVPVTLTANGITYNFRRIKAPL